MKIDVGLIKSYIKDYPVDNIVYNIGSTHEVLCNLLIGTELLWEGHESSNWIIDKEATDTLTGRRHKECTRCRKLLESEIYASDTYNEKYFTFYAASDGLSIEAKEGVTLVDEIVIPSTYKNAPVTHIEPDAFKNCTGITKITIPKSIVSIGDKAFQGCYNLESVKFAEGSQLTKIGVQAFDGCVPLRNITIPDNVTSIGNYAFYNCISLISAVIGSGVVSIGRGAFRALGFSKVYYKGTLSEWLKITIDSDNTELIKAARYYYSETEVTPGGNYWCYVNGEIFEWGNGLVFIPLDDDTYAVVSAGGYISGTVTIPSEYLGKAVTQIFDEGFSGCEYIEDVKLPHTNLTAIGDRAFKHSSIKNIEVPSIVTSLGSECFYESTLEGITFGSNSQLAEIPYGCFMYCHNISSISIPSNVTCISARAFNNSGIADVTFGEESRLERIEERAFFHCFELKSFAIPEGCLYIGNRAFDTCYKMTDVSIPASVIKIENAAFATCDKVKITVAEGNTHYKVEGGCLIEIESNEITFGNQYSTIPSTASSIGGDAFTGTYAAPIKIPLSVITIDSLAFRDCENLVLHVEAPSKPEGWADDWNDGSVTVVWGYVEDTNTYLVTESGEYLTDEQGNLLII